jgi:HTH-type transcriptional regulator / antitoxin HipB
VDYPIQILSQLRPILRSFRNKAGLTQAAVASKLGITQQSYAQIEANPASISVKRLHMILRLLNVTLVLTADHVEESKNEGLPASMAASDKQQPSHKLVHPSGKKEEW